MSAPASATPSGDRVRVAAFGAGWVTTNRHIPTMREHGAFDIRALVDRRGERASAAAAELGLPSAQAASVGELPFVDELDAVTCGTAPFAHYAVVKDALERGKHVLTEKPFTMTVEEGEELVALAAEHERTLAVVHNFQFASSMLKTQRWIASGRIGRIRSIWAMQLSNPKRRLPDWYDDLPLGLFYDESPHLIYLVRALAGQDLTPISTVAHPSTRGEKNTPAQLDVQLRAGDVPVMLQMNFEAPLSEWHVMLLGDEGTAMVDVFRDIAVFVPNDKGHGSIDVIRSSLSSTWHHWRGYLTSGVGHVRGTLRYGNDEVFRRFHESIATGVAPGGISAADALSVLKTQHWIVDAAAESFATGAAR